jgi:hypothetical protein
MIEVSGISAEEPKATLARRMASSVACALALVATPSAVVSAFATVNVQSVPAGSVGVEATILNASSLVDVPEFDPVTLNTDEPHPLVVGAASVPNWNVGSTTVTVSSALRGALSANLKDTDDGTDVTGLAMVRMLVVRAGSATAVEVEICANEISGTEASVTDTLRAA